MMSDNMKWQRVKPFSGYHLHSIRFSVYTVVFGQYIYTEEVSLKLFDVTSSYKIFAHIPYLMHLSSE